MALRVYNWYPSGTVGLVYMQYIQMNLWFTHDKIGFSWSSTVSMPKHASRWNRPAAAMRSVTMVSWVPVAVLSTWATAHSSTRSMPIVWESSMASVLVMSTSTKCSWTTSLQTGSRYGNSSLPHHHHSQLGKLSHNVTTTRTNNVPPQDVGPPVHPLAQPPLTAAMTVHNQGDHRALPAAGKPRKPASILRNHARCPQPSQP